MRESFLRKIFVRESKIRLLTTKTRSNQLNDCLRDFIQMTSKHAFKNGFF